MSRFPHLSSLRVLVVATLAMAFIGLPLNADAAPQSKSKQTSRTTVTGVVNLNTASVRQLSMLPGIGPKTAERIVAARPFTSPDQLMKVKGIGLKRYRALKDHLTTTGETTIAVKRAPRSSSPRAKTGGKASPGQPNASLALPQKSQS